MRRLRKEIVLGFVSLTCLSASAEATVISLDPRATYFQTDPADSPLDAIPIDLVSLGLTSGDVIRLRVVGDFSYCDFRNPSCDVDAGTFTTAVFASGPLLLPRDQPHRVIGAIDTGVDAVTSFDIAEDFALGSSFDMLMEIPPGATHLFVAPPDPFYGDNHDADGDYGVSISEVPEPTSLGLLGVGLVSLVSRRARRRRS